MATAKLIHSELSDVVIDAAMNGRFSTIKSDPRVSTKVARMIGDLAVTNLRLSRFLSFKFADLRWPRVVR